MLPSNARITGLISKLKEWIEGPEPGYPFHLYIVEKSNSIKITTSFKCTCTYLTETIFDTHNVNLHLYFICLI